MINYDFLCHKNPSVINMVLIFRTISKWQKWYHLQTHDIMSLLYISELNKSRLRCKDRTSQMYARVVSVLIRQALNIFVSLIFCIAQRTNQLFFSYLSNGSNADSCFSRVCITQVFLNFVSSAMASSFSVTASAENVFLMNFSKGFLKSTLSVRFSGRFIQPVMSSAAKLFVSPLFLSKFFLPSIEKILEAIFGSLHVQNQFYSAKVDSFPGDR